MVTATATRDEPDVQEWDDEWLVRRGNYVTLITPELAATLLQRNVNNRPPKLRKMREYSRDMRAGKWDPDASDIKFARTGELVDGQNRLMACVEADVPFATLVRTGLALQAKRHVDTGVARTAGDVLRMEGISGRPIQIAAACTLWVRYEDRVVNHEGKRLGNPSGGGHRSVMKLTHEELLDFLRKHPQLEPLSVESESVRRMVVPAFVASSITAFAGMAYEKDPDLLAQMFDRLRFGEFQGDDPLGVLVQYAARMRSRAAESARQHRGRVAQESNLLAFSRVWNALRGKEPIEGRLHIKLQDRLVMPQ